MGLRIAEPAPIPLKWMMVKAGTNQAEVARAIGVTREYVSEVCNGHQRASEQLRSQISAHLGIPEDDLFGVTYDNWWRTRLEARREHARQAAARIAGVAL